MGRKPVVQYVVEELARCGIGRLLFVTGPGKTAIENHFDIDAELIANLRETGKEELLAELAFEREDLEYFYTRQRRQLGLGHAVLCARPVVGEQCFVVALGDSIIGLHAQSRVVQTMIERFESAAGRRRGRLGGGAARGRGDPLRHRPAADGEGTGVRAGRPGREALRGRGPQQPGRGRPLRVQPAIFDCLEQTPPGKGDEIQLTDAIRMLIRDGGRGAGRAPAAGRAAVRHRQFRELLPGLRRVRAGRPAIRSRRCGRSTWRRSWLERGRLRTHAALIRKQAYARAGLVGNPSDGYYGKTISADRAEFLGRSDALRMGPDRAGAQPGGPEPLSTRWTSWPATSACTATTAASAWSRPRSRSSPSIAGASGIALHDRNFSVRYQSNIPRQVGLAGSSAIIVATLRCLMEFYGVEIPLRSPALAGPFGGDRGAGHRGRAARPRDPGLRGAGLHGLRPRADAEHRRAAVRRLRAAGPGLLPPLYLAYSADASEPTEVFHNDLRARFQQGEPAVVEAMRQFAELTVEGRAGAAGGRRRALRPADRSRTSTCGARSAGCRRDRCAWSTWPAACGATAHFAGSGGAIVGTCPDDATYARLESALGEIGCRVIRPAVW